jgi:hypothetical protein
MADNGIGVAVVSWYGPDRADQKKTLFAGFQVGLNFLFVNFQNVALF